MTKIDLWTFDVGAEASTPAAYADLMVSRVIESWDDGADIVLFPEFSWMGLSRFVESKAELNGISQLYWEVLWPLLVQQLRRKDKMAVLGTVPFATEDGSILNRAPIILGEATGHQDKLHLTPWETVLMAGNVLRIWEFGGLKIAVVICLDIEVPELAALLRGRGVDLILVPSATETTLGMERVGRCASARSVELCCHVGVAHLVGRGASELIDDNVGRVAWFSPSQSLFTEIEREELSEVITSGFSRLRVTLDRKMLQQCRQMFAETNPSLLTDTRRNIELVTC